MSEFENIDFWNAIIFYGLNSATYKLALGDILLNFAEKNTAHVRWELLAQSFLDAYKTRLKKNDSMPQQVNPARLTIMERIIAEENAGRLSYEEAIAEVGRSAFNDVIPRFHSIGQDKTFIKDKFYEADFGKSLVLKDGIFELGLKNIHTLHEELDARWSLLEGAFAIRRTQSQLLNDERLIYLENGYSRTNLTNTIPFLITYQGHSCFYCAQEMAPDNIDVDHVLPRQVVCHDEIWNLVLSHHFCNQLKTDKLIATHYLEKLVARNENIMGSNHPWKQKIEHQLGRTPAERARTLRQHYETVKNILGNYYWGGTDNYIPENDQFFKNLITRLNNG
jgi:hypothetical protein